MDTSHDRVVLTSEEHRILAILDDSSGHNGRRFRVLMALTARTAGLRSRRIRDAGAVLLFLGGAAIMVGTFTRWLPVAAVGVVMQGCALWWALTRLAPRVDAWISAKKIQASCDTGPSRPR
jgi:hypothetical protein